MGWRFWQSRSPNAEWSTTPGCYEQHLRRRLNNPLFPDSRTSIAKSELLHAQQLDKADEFALRRQVAEFLNSASPAVVLNTHPDISTTAELYRKALDLLQRSSEIGGLYADITDCLENIVSQAEGVLFTDPVTRDLLKRYEALCRMGIDVPLLAQAGRPDSPIPKGSEEFFQAALSESDSDLAILAKIFAGLGSKSFLENTTRILRQAVQRGYPQYEADRKLVIIEHEYETRSAELLNKE
jgi:hypothetical protein